MTSPSQEAIVESLFERTARGVLRFFGQSAWTTALLLTRPDLLPRCVRSGDRRLAPPLSYLTAMLFVAGVTVRMNRTLEELRNVGVDTVVNDVRQTLLGSSLASVAVTTFPCVLLVAVVGAVMTWLAKPRSSGRKTTVFAACCYAAGILYATIAAAQTGLIAFLVAYPLSLSDVPMHVAVGCFLFGVGSALWVVAVSVGQHAARRWVRHLLVRTPLAVTAVACFLAAGLALEASFDVEGAKQLGRALDRQQGRTGLEIDVLEHRFVTDPNGGPDQVDMLVALSNADATPIIARRPEELVPVRVPAGASVDLNTASVLFASLDRTAEPAMLIGPGETRLMQLRVVVPPTLTRPRVVEERWRYKFTYSASSEYRSFHSKTAQLWLPTPIYYPAEVTEIAKGGKAPTRR
ncbi:MAG: hypothetical protein AAF266_05880 [Planctomycetota bacterium]